MKQKRTTKKAGRKVICVSLPANMVPAFEAFGVAESKRTGLPTKDGTIGAMLIGKALEAARVSA